MYFCLRLCEFVLSKTVIWNIRFGVNFATTIHIVLKIKSSPWILGIINWVFSLVLLSIFHFWRVMNASYFLCSGCQTNYQRMKFNLRMGPLQGPRHSFSKKTSYTSKYNMIHCKINWCKTDNIGFSKTRLMWFRLMKMSNQNLLLIMIMLLNAWRI